jgi:hypothetical protein
MLWTKSLKTPTLEAIERTLARLGKAGANAYFFDRLSNPAWIEPLAERGFFKRPPDVDRTRGDGTFSLPDWPELRYLKKMAPLATEAVGNLVVAIPDTDNSQVRARQLEIGLHLGREHSQKLADRAIGWLDDTLALNHFGEPFARFVVHLLELGEAKRAVRLARRLFSSGPGKGPRRSARLDEWHYERCLNMCLPQLRQYAARQTLGLLRDLLLDAAREPQQGQAEDYSYIWRRDLLKANHSVKEITDILIDALRDTALELARRADAGFHVVRAALLAKHRLILNRILLFIAAEVCEANDPFVLETLLDTRLLDRHTCRAEYTLLLQEMYPRLSQPARERLLQAIARDPLLTIPEARRKELEPERLAFLGRTILRDRLIAFGTTLPSKLTGLRHQLIAELGEPIDPQVASAVWHGPTSPVAPETLKAMTQAELVTYLESWTPTGEFAAPTREGLARGLQQLVKDRAVDWSRSARSFVGLKATYVRGFISGLNDACVAKVRIEWPAVVELLQWVMSQPRELQTDHNALDEGEDPDWSWTRQSVARLLTTALTTPEAGLEWSLRDKIWSILYELLNDFDPPIDADPAEDRDPLTTSLNCVRGSAAHALFRFAWWVHNHLPKPEDSAELRFELMPEIREGVELVLNDRSTAIRSVLGDWFRTLFFFDSDWTRLHIDTIFPEAADLKPYWLASWRAFVDYDQPYDPAFGLLKSKYELAVERLQDASEEARKQMGETGLGHHLASYYWRGVGGDGTRALLLKYFERCSPAAAAHVLWSLGQGLQGTEPIAPATLMALVSLWSDLRAQSAHWTQLKRLEVYRHFGVWFISGRFDDRWILQELKHAIEVGAGIIDLEGVLTRLETLCGTFPREVAAILEPLVGGEQQRWEALISKPQVEGVLRALLRSPNVAARSQAEGIVNQLVENGSLFARDLLPAAAATDQANSPSPK